MIALLAGVEMSFDHMLDRLAAYARELDLHGTISLDSLIDSHRTLRAHYVADRKVWLKELENARAAGRAQGLEQVTQGEYISVEALRKMTVAELASFIGERD